ncbi:hypothetical protein NLN86_16320 [Citrobacter portucalensis]|uniref:Lipoprotein n=2 Tax=Citrobacter portucalensis TaxID=1639133 RepID=A0AAW5WDD9_9ENTR|nr:hypothetical protein [Citrobacter portucalensis]
MSTYQTMQNKNDKTILRFALLVLFTSMLSGCTLTRVSDSTHAKEVDELNVIGLSLEGARQRTTEKGFVCSEYGNVNTVVTEQGEHRWLQTECSKKSAELFCPQMRFVVLNVDPNTNRVVDVGNYVNQHTCF